MIAAGARIHETALVEGGVVIGEGTSVWDAVHIRGPGTTIGEDCIIGEKSYVAYGVAIADRVIVYDWSRITPVNASPSKTA